MTVAVACLEAGTDLLRMPYEHLLQYLFLHYDEETTYRNWDYDLTSLTEREAGLGKVKSAGFTYRGFTCLSVAIWRHLLAVT